MAQRRSGLTGTQKFYVSLLRLTGWMGLLVLPVFAFAWTAGALHREMPLGLVGLCSLLGLAGSVLLAGLSNRPTYLLRPTSFLKGLVVFASCAVLCGLIAIQVVVMVLPIRIDLLAPWLDVWAVQLLQGYDERLVALPSSMGEGARLVGMPAGFQDSALFAAMTGFVAALPAGMAALMALFLRFPGRGPMSAGGPRRAARAMARDAAQKEKAAAMRAMRIRRSRKLMA